MVWRWWAQVNEARYNSPTMRQLAISLFLLLALSAGWTQVLPKPQIASAQGKPAPNFSLQDQNGKTVRLSSLRGKRVLLVFFRGTW